MSVECRVAGDPAATAAPAGAPLSRLADGLLLLAPGTIWGAWEPGWPSC